MNDYKTIEAKLWNAISMLTSGVLTSLIYGLLSASSYEIDIEGKQYTITAIGMSDWVALTIVLITFLGLWTLISVFIPWLLRIKRRLSYDKIKKITAKELIRTLDEVEVSIKELSPIFFTPKDNAQHLNQIKLHCRDLAKIILLLKRRFLPQNQALRKTIKKYFRQYEHTTIVTMQQKVSGYELNSVVEILRDMVATAQTKLDIVNDKLLSKDLKEMEIMLNELRKSFAKEETDALRGEQEK